MSRKLESIFTTYQDPGNRFKGLNAKVPEKGFRLQLAVKKRDRKLGPIVFCFVFEKKNSME